MRMTTIELDIRELDRRAVEQTIDLVGRIRPEDLARATPCAGWTLADLLRHMTAQNRGFAAAGRGQGADPANWELPEADSDLVAAYLASARDLIQAYAAEDILEKSFRLPDFSPTAEFPAAQAISFHFIDYVVHGWDVAQSLGQKYLLDAELAAPALRLAHFIPDGAERLAEGAAFAPGLPVDPQASELEQILRLLGRDPDHG